LLGIRLGLEIPGCLEPCFSGATSRFVTSPERLCLRARPLGGRRWAVDYGPHRRFGEACGPAALYYRVDKALILELQRRRSDLLFLHAAVLGNSTGAIAVLATSGVGKSTTSLSALRARLACFSDELAPVDLETLRVWPYPRALALKRRPGRGELRAMGRTHRIGQQWFLPLETNRLPARGRPVPLRALVILNRGNDKCSRTFNLTGAAALANVYSHCLNPMAHEKGGLPAVKRLLDVLPCYHHASVSPEDSIELLQRLL
jgi:hypothetical protein